MCYEKIQGLILNYELTQKGFLMIMPWIYIEIIVQEGDFDQEG